MDVVVRVTTKTDLERVAERNLGSVILARTGLQPAHDDASGCGRKRVWLVVSSAYSTTIPLLAMCGGALDS